MKPIVAVFVSFSVLFIFSSCSEINRTRQYKDSSLIDGKNCNSVFKRSRKVSCEGDTKLQSTENKAEEVSDNTSPIPSPGPGESVVTIDIRKCGAPLMRDYYVSPTAEGFNKVHIFKVNQSNPNDKNIVFSKLLPTRLPKNYQFVVPNSIITPGYDTVTVFCKPSIIPDLPPLSPDTGGKEKYYRPINCLESFTGPALLTAENMKTSVFYKTHNGDWQNTANDPECDESISSPLIIDYNGGGIEATSLAKGIQYDLNNDGSAEHTAWISSGSPFLALDRNGDGKITNGGELFGNHTGNAANGFDALRHLDTNHDGKIDKRDKDFSKLLLWFDKNQDGISQESELLPIILSQIESISLSYKNILEVDDYGNETRQRSKVVLKNKIERVIVDLWFKTVE